MSTAHAGRVRKRPTTTEAQAQAQWKWWHTLSAVAIVAVIVALAVFASTSDSLAHGKDNLPLWIFLVIAALLIGFIVLVGWGITGIAAGALIDPKKGRMSLSRLQLVLWTVLIIAAFLTAFLVNIAKNAASPLSVAIPGELLVAMGISITSLAGTGVVLNVKRNQPSNGMPDDVKTMLEARDVPVADDTTGVIKLEKASFRDVFEGDTPQSATYLDLGKIQMFYITIALVLGYGIAVGAVFSSFDGSADITSLPSIDEGFVALLGISHAGYLTTKAAS
jgi:K+-sensing histidine kinase KdpD